MRVQQRMSSRLLVVLAAVATFRKLALHRNYISTRRYTATYPKTYQQHIDGQTSYSIQGPSSTGDSPASIYQSYPPRDTSRWIYVEEFSEGMATWRISFAEILMAAKKLNATVVEPCIGGGRLRTCRDAKYRLGQVYDLERLRQFHPYIVSYAEYQAMLTRDAPLIVTMCHQIQGGNPSPFMVCGQNVTNMFQVPSNHLLDQALQQVHGTTVIHIKYYRMSGFRITKVGRNRLVLPRFIDSILSEYFDFTGYHYDTVDNLLHSMGISSNNSDFDVIHWRAELPNIHYDDCASKILQTRDAMNSNTTVLMSSLNRQASLQWFIPYRQGQAIQSLNRLSEAGMYKLDQALQKHHDMLLPDTVVIAVWDQIMALKATRFVTCTKGCRQRHDACVSCNYLGNYAQMAIGIRQSHGKSSDECWPI